jgi:hypothetical protein
MYPYFATILNQQQNVSQANNNYGLSVDFLQILQKQTPVTSLGWLDIFIPCSGRVSD